MTRIVNRAELSEIFGVVPSTITSWQLLGMPVVKKGRRGIPDQFDSAACLRWHLEYATRPPSSADPGSPTSRKLSANATLKELELERRLNQVAPVALFVQVAASLAGQIDTVLSRLPSKLAPIVAAEIDQTKCQWAIDKAINEAREEIIAAGKGVVGSE